MNNPVTILRIREYAKAYNMLFTEEGECKSYSVTMREAALMSLFIAKNLKRGKETLGSILKESSTKTREWIDVQKNTIAHEIADEKIKAEYMNVFDILANNSDQTLANIWLELTINFAGVVDEFKGIPIKEAN